MIPGNLSERKRKLSPIYVAEQTINTVALLFLFYTGKKMLNSLTGEKHNTKCKLFMACFIKNSYKLSRVGTPLGFFFLKLGTRVVNISSSSSLGNKFATSPELNMLFMYSRKDSSLISLSVNTNVVFVSSIPARL